MGVQPFLREHACVYVVMSHPLVSSLVASHLVFGDKLFIEYLALNWISLSPSTYSPGLRDHHRGGGGMGRVL